MNFINYRTRGLTSALFGNLRAIFHHHHNPVETPINFSNCSLSKLSSESNRPTLLNQNLHWIANQQRLDPFRRYLTTVSDQLYSQHQDYLELAAVEHGFALKIPYVWLRDHCRCAECFNSDTNQRTFDTFKIDLDEAPTDIQIDNQSIKITWQDSHESTFDLNWLKVNAPGSGVKETVEKILWDGEQIQRELPADVPYDEFMQNDESLRLILMNIHKYGFGIVGGCPLTEEETVVVSERVGHLRNTFFGRSWAFTSNAAFADSSYSNEGIGVHNDNTYLLEPSGIQVFHCLFHDGSGGENVLVDGFKAAATLKMKHPDYYEALLQIPLQAEYIGDDNKVISTINLLKENPITKQLDAIRYNPFDRAVLSHTSFEDTKLFYKALKALSAEIKSPVNEFWIKLTPGQVLLVDNWRVLHGRAPFDGKRVMAGCYLPKDQLNSRLRSVAGLTLY